MDNLLNGIEINETAISRIISLLVINDSEYAALSNKINKYISEIELFLLKGKEIEPEICDKVDYIAKMCPICIILNLVQCTMPV